MKWCASCCLVDEQEVVGEHRIFMDQYYGISTAFKLEEPIIAPDIRDLVFLSNND
ncbi:MAG: hypothetical protein VXW44_11000 [SAR324 cluster bacterium]|nr:hypothetical protein [SAR324 cluster bacterium]